MIFTRFFVTIDDVAMHGAKGAFEAAYERHVRALEEGGADPDSIDVYRAWSVADGLAVSVMHKPRARGQFGFDPTGLP